MSYLINTLAVIGFVVIFCVCAGYVWFRLELYLDNQIQGLITTDTDERKEK
jgi:hypothetical protein